MCRISLLTFISLKKQFSIKRTFKISLWFTGIIIVLMSVLYLTFKSPYIQKLLIKNITESFFKNTGIQFNLKSVDIKFFNYLALNEVVLNDNNKDTLLYVDVLKINILDLNTLIKKSILDELIIEKGKFVLRKNEIGYNTDFIKDLFNNEKSNSNNRFLLKGINIEDFEFDFINNLNEVENKKYLISKFEVESLIIDSIRYYGKIKNFRIENIIDSISIKDFSSIVSYSNKKLNLLNTKIKTNLSNIEFDADLIFDDSLIIKNSEVLLNIKKSSFSTKEINHFSEKINLQKDFLFSITGKIKYINQSLKSKDFSISTGDKSYVKTRILIDNLLDIENSFFRFEVYDLFITPKDISYLGIEFHDIQINKQFYKTLNKTDYLHYRGNLTGNLYSFVNYGKFKTSAGSFSSDISFKKNLSTNKYNYNGQLKFVDLNIGKFLDKNFLGKVSLEMDVKGNELDFEKAIVETHGIISKLEINNYTYKNIEIDGALNSEKFDGSLSVRDDNLLFNFDGSIDLEPERPIFNFEAEIVNAKPYKLNIFPLDSLARLTTKVSVNMKGLKAEDFEGNFLVHDFKLIKEGKSYSANKIDLSSMIDDVNGKRNIVLKSNFLDVNINGQIGFVKLWESLKHLLDSYSSNLYSINDLNERFQNYNINGEVFFKDFQPLSEIFVPNLRMSDNSYCKFGLNTSSNMIDIQLFANKLFFKETSFNNFNFNISTSERKDSLLLNIIADDYQLSEKVKFNNFNFNSYLSNNIIGFNLLWDNQQDQNTNSGNLKGKALIYPNKKYRLHFDDFQVIANDTLWRLNQDNLVETDSNCIKIENLRFKTRSQNLIIEGVVSENPYDVLHIDIGRLNLANFNVFSKRDSVNIGGIAKGKMKVSNIYKELFFYGEIEVDQLHVNNKLIGPTKFKSSWDNENKVLALQASIKSKDVETINLSGLYYPERVKDNLDITLNLNKFRLNMLEAYMNTYLSDIDGKATGTIKLEGSFKEPELSGSVKVRKGKLKVNYLNTTYTFTDEVSLTKGGIHFNNILVNDEEGSSGYLNGTISHNYFTNLFFDFDIKIDEPFLCLNTTIKDNELIYGKVYATGTAKIFGSFYNPVIDIYATTSKSKRTGKKSIVSIPYNDDEELGESSIIRFKKDPKSKVIIEDINKKDLYVDPSNVTVNVDIKANQDVIFRVVFDEVAGDVMRATGNADLRVNANTNGLLEVYGEYNIDEGDYLFTLENIINKKFNIRKGGKLTWTGDPYDAIVDLDAVYEIRTSLKQLGIDTTNTSNLVVMPIECILNLSNKLMHPYISFDINLPQAEIELINEMKSLISTEEEMNKQVFALLVLHSFVPSGQSVGGTSGVGSSAVGANTSELLTAQISNWLSQISNEWDIGVKYRPGDQISKRELELALSTQLFNDRLLVDGNFGSINNQQASNLVGDVNFEYKMSEDGKIRIKAFNRTNAYKVSELEGLYTQGIGLFYREEFNSLEELINKYVYILGIENNLYIKKLLLEIKK